MHATAYSRGHNQRRVGIEDSRSSRYDEWQRIASTAATVVDDGLRPVLCALADPQAPAPPADSFLKIDPQDLFDAVLHHGLEPVALPKLSAILPKEPPYLALIDRMRERQFLVNAQCLNLDAYAKRVMLAIEYSGRKAVIVRGPAFAKALYDRSSDRPFTDIDILAHRAAVRPIGRLLKQAGFDRKRRWLRKSAFGNMEQKWSKRGDPSIVIELHGNLVHSPGLRRRISFGFDEYRIAAGDGAFPTVAHFMTAVIQASVGHGFQRLQLLVDVLQALRRLEDRDLKHLGVVLGRLNARLEVLVCLDMVYSLFEEPAALHALERLSAGRNYHRCRRLVTPDAVLDTWKVQDRRTNSRRHAFRWAQHLVRRG